MRSIYDIFRKRWAGMGLLLAFLFLSLASAPGSQLTWDREKSLVSANVKSSYLTNLLAKLSITTGWQIFLEPDTERIVTAKFNERPVGDALKLLLGDLSYALLPQANGPPKFFVFRTSVQEATLLIKAPPSSKSNLIGNELIITLKPGQKIEDIARLLGAKVAGSIKDLNVHRLTFADEDAAKAAREVLKLNPGVADIDSNYLMPRPMDADALNLASSPFMNLKAKPVGDGNQVVVGLIDTAVQPLSKELEAFILNRLSVAGESGAASGALTHGTAMAETILKGMAQLVTDGQASGVKFLCIDVYGKGEQTTTWNVGLGAYEAINRGANVINFSLGGENESSYLYSIIQAAQKKGIIMVAAAGNQPGTAPTYPAAYPEVIAVTAGDRKGNIASYANSGSFVDGIAPGTSVVPYDNRSYIITGTSAATAFASGYAAAIADRSGKNSAEVQAALLKMIGIGK